jgi:hypothetical protein
MTMDVSRYACARDSLAIALTQRFLAIYTPLVGECHLTLTLTDGTDVESNTWIERGNGR